MKFLLIASLADSLLNFRKDLIEALQKKGYEIHVAAPDLIPRRPAYQKLQEMGVTMHNIHLQRAGMNVLRDLQTLWQLCRIMSVIAPDIVMPYTIKPIIYGGLAARFTNVQQYYALITGLGYAFQGEQGQRSILKAVAKKLYRYALGGVSKVFFQNPDDAELFRQLGIISERTSVCVVNGSGVDTNFFHQQPLPRAPVRFLLIARLLGDKGVREYARAAQQIRQDYPEVQFALAGWIDDNPDAISESELDAWVNAGDVIYLGRLEDVRLALAQCHAYVLPSYREGTPRSVLEAMATGRAIVTTNAPGCKETVIDGVNGFLVRVKSTDDLVAALCKLLEQPELFEQMGSCSRSCAEKKYDVHEVNAHMLREMGIT